MIFVGEKGGAAMPFDVRFDHYTFKHTIDNAPTLGRDMFDDHYHTEFELLYFIRGNADLFIEEQRFRGVSNALMVVRPGDHHYLNINDQSCYERIVIRFDGAALPESLQRALWQLAPVYDIRNTELARLFLRLDDQCALVEGELQRELLKCSLTELLIYLCAQDTATIQSEPQNRELQRVIDYIDANLQSIQVLDELCAGLHMSRSAVNRLFAKHMHVPVMAYLRTKKCIFARNLIQRGVPPTEACYQAGFAEYSTFYRAYVSVFRQPPSGER